MKLIKRGTKNDRTFRGTCHGCGSEWEATETELQGKIVVEPREGDFARNTCSQCNSTFVLYPRSEYHEAMGQ